MTTNRAVIVREFGLPDSFSIEEWDPGAPGLGEVRIRVRAVGLAFVDALIAQGLYQVRPALPFVPGCEFAGTIEAVGDGVSPERIGERVSVTELGGGLRETAIVPAAGAKPVPDAMPLEEAAIFRASYETVYHALVQRAALAPGEILCVLGAGGAIGLAAVQLGKALGATVIASASTAEKRAMALDSGADHAVDSQAPGWREQVRAASDRRGIDVVVDPLGGRFTESAFRALGWGGRHLVIGFAAGDIPRLPVNLALLKGASLLGVNIREMIARRPDIADANTRELLRLYGEGKVRPRIARIHPLDAFATAMNEARSGEHCGRVIVRP